MKLKLFLFSIISVLIFSCSVKHDIEYKSKLVNPPVATRQLGSAIFVPNAVIKELKINEGNSIEVIHNDKKLEMRVYDSFDSLRTFGMYRKYADMLNLKYDSATVILRKLSKKESKLKPKPIKHWVENNNGDTTKWRRIAYGAPHGDCDYKTGEIIKVLTDKYGIPSTSAWGCRFSYRGRWYDCNRPLMKLPNPDGGTYRDRVWNDKAMEIYQNYQNMVWKNNNMKYGDRFELFMSFHGHDLSVKTAEGEWIERPVMEGMGVGFSIEELRKVKEFYYKNKNKYYENPPDLYFGNLPEDQTYECEGQELTFYYSGLGTRTYGSLRSDLVKYAFHIETPNSMRIDPDIWDNTADFLYDLYVFALDSIIEKKSVTAESQSRKEDVIAKSQSIKDDFGKKVKVSGGVYLRGSEENVGWSSERPQHKVDVAPFEIDIYEVTNKQFVDFLNRAIGKKIIIVENGIVKDAKNQGQIILKLRNSAPASQIVFDDGKFTVIEDKDYFPVVYVTYFGAEMYAEINGERLPTEAEWEMASSWDFENKRKYHYSTSTDEISGEIANFSRSDDAFDDVEKIPATTPVGYYDAKSPSGCYDMSGNVWEWCKDFYIYKPYKNAPEGVWNNPITTEETTMNVIRGGSWDNEFSVLRSTMRLGISPNATLVNVGFRCVR